MSKIHWLLILGLAIAVPALTQESGDNEAPAADTAQSGETADVDADSEAEDEAADDAADEFDPLEEFDDEELDEQTYEEDDDEFVPTEEIPSDEPIPFPTNI